MAWLRLSWAIFHSLFFAPSHPKSAGSESLFLQLRLMLTPDPRSRQGPDPFLGLIGTMDALAIQGRVEVWTMDRKVHLLWHSVVQPGSIAAGLHAGKKMGWERRELWKKLRDG